MDRQRDTWTGTINRRTDGQAIGRKDICDNEIWRKWGRISNSHDTREQNKEKWGRMLSSPTPPLSHSLSLSLSHTLSLSHSFSFPPPFSNSVSVSLYVYLSYFLSLYHSLTRAGALFICFLSLSFPFFLLLTQILTGTWNVIQLDFYVAASNWWENHRSYPEGYLMRECANKYHWITICCLFVSIKIIMAVVMENKLM